MQEFHDFNKSNRRAFLKGAGVAIALPFLASNPLFASLTKSSTSQASPKRMVFIASGLGMYPGSFFPRNFGLDFTPSPVLEPLRNLREDVTVFSHMDHPSLFNKHGGQRTLLSGMQDNAPSVDQIAAAHVGYDTRFPSIHISIGGAQGASTTRSGIKVREENNPFDLFKKLFVKDSDKARQARKLEIDRQGSVLDLVKSQAKLLSKSVNPADRDKLDEYLTAIREAEQKLQGMKKWQDYPKPKVDFDSSIKAHGGMDYPTLAPMMFDLLHLAIESDSSRVITAGFGMHNKRIEIDGVDTGYHSLSHHGMVPAKLKQLQIIETFYIEQYARFIQKLKESKTGTSSLLDETMVFFGSGLSDAARHSNRNLPIILSGGGFKHQGHVDAAQHNGRQTPLNNLYTSMLQNFGVEIEKFNDAKGTVSFG